MRFLREGSLRVGQVDGGEGDQTYTHTLSSMMWVTVRGGDGEVVKSPDLLKCPSWALRGKSGHLPCGWWVTCSVRTVAF